jgi:hypothetical protein
MSANTAVHVARLRCGLALVFGIEPTVILKDVFGLD